MKRVLFLCTGNYYRSRFAEIYFNHRASALGLDWRAESRALLVDLTHTGNIGPISPHAVRTLEAIGVPVPEPARFPLALADGEAARFDRIVALDRSEHEPFVADRLPSEQGRVDYFDIRDVEDEAPEASMARLRRSLDRVLAGCLA